MSATDLDAEAAGSPARAPADAPDPARTEEEVQAWVGVELDAGFGEVTAEHGYVLHWLEATENDNPIYWEPELAEAVVGHRIAPPSMLSVWMRPLMHKPGRERMIRPLELHFVLKDALGLPKGIVASNDITFGEPVRFGDRVRTVQSVRSISPVKEISLGTGRFWTIDVTYTNQRDEVVGVESYDFFCYA